MIINRITRNRYPFLTLGGLSAADAQARFITVNEISSPSDALSSAGVTAVVYDDTPLLTETFLRTLAASLGASVGGYALGDGFIKKEGYNGVLTHCACKETARLTPASYSAFVREINRRIIRAHISDGVIFPDECVRVDFGVRICTGTIIEGNTVLEGNCFISRSVRITDSHIRNSRIGHNTIIRNCVIEDSTVGDNTTIGPFAYIRNNSAIGNNCRIGDFAEIKNSVLGNGVKAAHLAYVGDATVGENTNIGCGTVFCNYDGKTKHKTAVGKNVFIGANTNLVAPVKVGDGAFIAAGSTVTDDIPDGAFAIARERQTTKKK